MKYTINELANSKGVSQPVREALLQMADYKQLYEQVCEQYDVLAKELDATNRQVEILSDALAESRREVAALKDVQEPVAWVCYGAPGKRDIDFEEADINKLPIGTLLYTTPPSAPVQEPVAIALNTGTKQGVKWLKNVEHGESLYTTPPAAKRQWVGLTDEERTEIRREHYARTLPLIDAVEAKLKERNQ